jgi:hypothetical protein
MSREVIRILFTVSFLEILSFTRCIIVLSYPLNERISEPPHKSSKVSKLSLYWNKHQAMKAYGEWRYSSTHSLTSALVGGEWSASSPGNFTPRERAPCTHRIGGSVEPRAVWNAVMKRKIPSPRRESKPRTPLVQLVAQCYTDWVITAVL